MPATINSEVDSRLGNKNKIMYENETQQRQLIIKLAIIFVAVVFLFGLSYYGLEFFSHGGLRNPEKSSASFLECLFFSIVTVTTLGYGDITAIGFARALASVEALFGLVYAGYSISQIVSFKQERLINYLAGDRLIQTYDLCLAELSDAKEMIADRRRAIQTGQKSDFQDYFYFRLNPFYPAIKAMRALVGYTAHIEDIGKTSDLCERIERAAHHVEELAGFTRKLVNILENERILWRTDRTVMLLEELCELVDRFSECFIRYTKYADKPYKSGGMYLKLIETITKDITAKTKGTIAKYRKTMRARKHSTPVKAVKRVRKAGSLIKAASRRPLIDLCRSERKQRR
ncbi:potassium channel family protein [Paraburkholderia sp. JHI869]|uniref:potassium channel family protein n=1 Tax=Paraburkholderia sp. JHI869 TaxID=3112959 RepID=UPI00318198D5